MSFGDRPTVAERQAQYSEWAQRLRRQTHTAREEARELDGEEESSSRGLSDEWSPEALFASSAEIPADGEDEVDR
ncbi:MAG: hypothetical protein JJU45_06645 [Acidimicrobiia bacterium]|nr:hypothetical protein [Acidimicrobiia bacterium]